MSARKNILQSRAIPLHDGPTPISYVPYSFGNVKPLTASPFTFLLTNAAQTYLNVRIPANTWANWKRLYVTAEVEVSVAPAPAPGVPIFTDLYQINTQPPVTRSGPTVITGAASVTTRMIQRTFILFPGNDIWEENYTQNPAFNLTSPDGIIHKLALTAVPSLFDPTTDNDLQFQFQSNSNVRSDTIDCKWAQAFIQSPLDLNRLPR